MRKRIAIAVLAIIGVGILAYVVSQPKKGSVEWHKKEFRAAYNRANGPTWENRIEATVNRLVGEEPPSPFVQTEQHAKAAKEAQSHLAALVKLGFLVERQFVITNRTINQVLTATLPMRRQLGSNQPPWSPLALRERVTETNVLVVTGLPGVVSQYDKLIGNADVPETVK